MVVGMADEMEIVSSWSFSGAKFLVWGFEGCLRNMTSGEHPEQKGVATLATMLCGNHETLVWGMHD
jgi:hypothetical protein